MNCLCAAEVILEAQPDQDFSFVLRQAHGLAKAFTFDHRFATMEFMIIPG